MGFGGVVDLSSTAPRIVTSLIDERWDELLPAGIAQRAIQEQQAARTSGRPVVRSTAAHSFEPSFS